MNKKNILRILIEIIILAIVIMGLFILFVKKQAHEIYKEKISSYRTSPINKKEGTLKNDASDQRKDSSYPIYILKNITSKDQACYYELNEENFDWFVKYDTADTAPPIKVAIEGWKINCKNTVNTENINKYFLEDFLFEEDLLNAADGPNESITGFRKHIESKPQSNYTDTICLTQVNFTEDTTTIKCGILKK